MIEEYLPLIYFTGALILIIYSIKKVSEVLKARMVTKSKIAGKPGQINIPYNSLLELCTESAKAIQLQIDTITPKIPVENRDKDVALKALISQRNTFSNIAGTISNNQLLMVLDQQAFPFVKDLIPVALNGVKRWISNIGY